MPPLHSSSGRRPPCSRPVVHQVDGGLRLLRASCCRGAPHRRPPPGPGPARPGRSPRRGRAGPATWRGPHATASAMPSTARWLSLNITQSDRLPRWFTRAAGPHRRLLQRAQARGASCGCPRSGPCRPWRRRRRSGGSVVATPDRWHRKFSAVRSPVRIDASGPVTVPTTCCGATASPSTAAQRDLHGRVELGERLGGARRCRRARRRRGARSRRPRSSVVGQQRGGEVAERRQVLGQRAGDDLSEHASCVIGSTIAAQPATARSGQARAELESAGRGRPATIDALGHVAGDDGARTDLALRAQVDRAEHARAGADLHAGTACVGPWNSPATRPMVTKGRITAPAAMRRDAVDDDLAVAGCRPPASTTTGSPMEICPSTIEARCSRRGRNGMPTRLAGRLGAVAALGQERVGDQGQAHDLDRGVERRPVARCGRRARRAAMRASATTASTNPGCSALDRRPQVLGRVGARCGHEVGPPPPEIHEGSDAAVAHDGGRAAERSADTRMPRGRQAQ